MHYCFLTLLTLTTTATANPFFEPKANDGYTSRLWGITLDTIVALDVVLANGSFIHATETTHPDIYYALSGAADSFSITTTFHLQTQPSPASVVNWAYTLPGLYDSAAAPIAAFTHTSRTLPSTHPSSTANWLRRPPRWPILPYLWDIPR